MDCLPQIGAEALLRDGDTDAMMAFYGGLFERLPTEVGTPGELTRVLTFQSPVDADQAWHRLGLEVPAPVDPPSGLTCWDLGAMDWRWQARDATGRLLGGYTAPDGREFELSGAAYLLPGGPPAPDEVELVEPDPDWPAQYAAAEAWLRERLDPGVALRIEHYGSTAVPGLCAKPVIDVLLELPSFDVGRRALLPVCSGPEWEYWWYSGHHCLIRRDAPFGHRIWHIHAAPAGHRLFEGLAFRDHLRADSGDAARYAELKRGLAAAHRGDRERYTLAKGEFVREVTQRALSG